MERISLEEFAKKLEEYNPKGFRFLNWCPICWRILLDEKEVLQRLPQAKDMIEALEIFYKMLKEKGDVAVMDLFFPTDPELDKLVGHRVIVFGICRDCFYRLNADTKTLLMLAEISIEEMLRSEVIMKKRVRIVA